MGFEKPDPRIFKEACRRAGVRPAEALMVGDDWAVDVVGGRRAGMQAAFLGLPPRGRRLGAVLRLRRIDELPHKLS